MSDIDKNRLDLSSPNRFVQFQLWRDCEIGCKFCQNRGLKNQNSKIDNIQFVIDTIKNNRIIKEYNEIGIIGGELFGKQLRDEKVRSKFFELVKLIAGSEQFKKFYLGTALIFKDLIDLFLVLEIFREHKKLDNVLICTSYDTIYRFNENGYKRWSFNMKAIHDFYPSVKLHVEIILTEDFCQKVIKHQFNPREFAIGMNCHIDYIEPMVNIPNISIEEYNKRLPNFLPRRKTFLEFLKFGKEHGIIDFENFLSPNLHSDLYFIEQNGKPYVFDGRRKNNDELLKNYCEILERPYYYSRYADVDRKLIDDVKIYKESTEC